VPFIVIFGTLFLLQTDRTTRSVSWNLVYCCTTAWACSTRKSYSRIVLTNRHSVIAPSSASETKFWTTFRPNDINIVSEFKRLSRDSDTASRWRTNRYKTKKDKNIKHKTTPSACEVLTPDPDVSYGLMFRRRLKGHLFREGWTRRSVTSDLRRYRKHLSTYLLTSPCPVPSSKRNSVPFLHLPNIFIRIRSTVSPLEGDRH